MYKLPGIILYYMNLRKNTIVILMVKGKREKCEHYVREITTLPNETDNEMIQTCIDCSEKWYVRVR